VQDQAGVEPYLKATYLREQREKQYHLHATLLVSTPTGGTEERDTAVNVGTNDRRLTHISWNAAPIKLRIAILSCSPAARPAPS
jgi:hypothetical protein